MSKLTEVFESIKHVLHWGPGVEPFHREVIFSVEQLEKANAKLKDEVQALKDRFDAMFPERSPEPPSYIHPPISILSNPDSVQSAAVQAISAPVPDDGASLIEEHTPENSEPQAEAPAAVTETNPAEPGITPSLVSLSAQPEPVSAGPDAGNTAPESTAPASETASSTQGE